MKNFLTTLGSIAILTVSAFAQIPTATHIAILKAEDARRYDKTLEDMLKSPNEQIRIRAALAAGRIGNDAAIPALASLLENDKSITAREMAAFALGEIESIKAADILLKALTGAVSVPLTRPPGRWPLQSARLVEAAGKIAAANAKDEKSKELGKALLVIVLEKTTDRESVILGLTALLRARPDGADMVVAGFLTNDDARVRADAANTLARIRVKNANTMEEVVRRSRLLSFLRKMVTNDPDAVARANAARVLGSAEDKEAVDILIKAATNDADSRVRVSAMRALGSLKDERAAQPLEDHLTAMVKQVIRRDGKILATAKYYAPPPEQNEWLEITTALGNILAGKKDTTAPSKNSSSTFYETAPPRLMTLIMNPPESSIARAKIDPEFFMLGMLERYTSAPSPIFKDWRSASSLAQGFGIVATLPKDKYPEYLGRYQTEAQQILRLFMADKGLSPMAMPDVLTAYAAFKPNDLGEVLRRYLQHTDVQIRGTAANLLADMPGSKENVDALKSAFPKALLTDKFENDAQLAILDALFKLDKKESVGTMLVALSAQDYLVRKSAFAKLEDKDLVKDFPGLPTSLANARAKQKDQVLPYSPVFGTKLGQVLNTDADYRRATSRKNGNVKAVFTTEKGTFTIDLLAEDAPLTVDNFIKLARANYFNGVEVHRVVPNFVMQDGDPRGDGNGGPGWSIRCEVNMIPYERGAVGMALSGKDTGGSQWFVTHSPQPHLDGGYTVFGRVNESDMKVVDNIVRGDKIISVKILEKR